ncbi:MAG: efflux RND transporter permease subunit [Candidatus Rickettsia vulgarisii]
MLLPPIYNKVNPADSTIITLALTSETLKLPIVEDLAETRLVQKISQISGVGLVTISGGQRPAIRVQVNQNRLAALGLAFSDIQNSIEAANVNAAKGNLDGTNLSYVINTNDQLLSADDYKQIIVAYKNGNPIRLLDIVNVIDDVENTKQAAWVNKTPAIVINIQRQPGANVIKVADSIKNLLPHLSSTLPKSIKVSIISDRTNTIRASISM